MTEGEVSNLPWDMLALQVRYGGLGIANSEKTADKEYKTSRKVTEKLTELIKQQKILHESISRNSVNTCIAKPEEEKEETRY